MSRPVLLLLAALATALAAASLALASSQQLNDERGDSTSDVDLAGAKLQFDGKRLHFTVRAYGELPSAHNPCVEIKRDNFVGCFGNEITNPDPESELNGVPVRVEHGRKKNEFTVSWKKLDRPPKISWRAVFLEEDVPADAAPDNGYSAVKLKP
jgi:hypothetical protein